jgi:hypothetical protein
MPTLHDRPCLEADVFSTCFAQQNAGARPEAECTTDNFMPLAGNASLQRTFAREAAHAASTGKMRWNSIKDWRKGKLLRATTSMADTISSGCGCQPNGYGLWIALTFRLQPSPTIKPKLV